MVPSLVITIAADDEYLTCGGFFLGETVRLRNFEFIANYFGGLSLFPMRGDSGTAFMGSTRSGASSPWRTMIEEFLTALSGVGGFDLPSPKRCGTGALPAPVTTTPWLKDILDIVTAQ
jgi:hypothetical protein